MCSQKVPPHLVNATPSHTPSAVAAVTAPTTTPRRHAHPVDTQEPRSASTTGVSRPFAGRLLELAEWDTSRRSNVPTHKWNLSPRTWKTAGIQLNKTDHLTNGTLIFVRWLLVHLLTVLSPCKQSQDEGVGVSSLVWKIAFLKCSCKDEIRTWEFQ